MKIAINELFHSIQGEGPNCGYPSVFIRFQGCQLRCPWCDTGHSLDPDDPHRDMTVDEILTAIDPLPARHAVITGGDPSFQMEGLEALSRALDEAGYTLEMETSGLKPVPAEICERYLLVNVGLKLPNAEQRFGDNYYRTAAQHYGAMDNADFKIVITDKADVVFVRDRLLESGLLAPERVCLMPLGDTVAQQEANAGLVIAACKELNVRFSPRLHIMFNQR